MWEALAAALDERDIGSGLGSTGKSLRKLHRQQQRVMEQPAAVVQEYWNELCERTGAEPEDVFRVYHYTAKVNWGRFKGLQRVHFHVSHILDRLLHDRPDQAAAYAAQLCRAVHQVVLDGGGWDSASLLLPKTDPLQKTLFGGSQTEMEIVANYRDTLKKLEKAHGSGGGRPDGKKE